MERINLDETLVIATADHSHAFSIMGYPPLNNPILGFSEDTYSEKTPKEKFPTLVYGAGPGVKAGIPPENANKDFQGTSWQKNIQGFDIQSTTLKITFENIGCLLSHSFRQHKCLNVFWTFLLRGLSKTLSSAGKMILSIES